MAGCAEGLDNHNHGMVPEERSASGYEEPDFFKNRACSVHNAISPGERTGWELLEPGFCWLENTCNYRIQLLIQL